MTADTKLATLKSQVKKRKIELHYILKHDYRKWFAWMDIIMVCAILFNIGALVLTNINAVKEYPDAPIYETDPVAAKINSYQLHPEYKMEIFAFMLNIAIYSMMIGVYWVLRHNLYERHHLVILAGCIAILCFILMTDFFNNFGYFVGKHLFNNTKI